MSVVSITKLKSLEVVKLNFGIRVICLLIASLIVTPALSQGMSGWSDKTVCRLVESDGGALYVEEATNRGLDCKAPIKADKAKPKFDSSTGIDRFGGISEIPESANPNDETLKFYLYRYLYANNIYPFCGSENKELHCEGIPPFYSHPVEPSNNPYKFQSDLREDQYIKQQMQETPLLSYLLYEDGKIVIDEITPKDRFGDMFTDSSRLHSQSVAKSLVSYVAGHAICKGYIKSVDSRVDDWSAVKNTLYDNQKLINLLNMNAGDHNYLTFKGIINSNRWYNSYPVEDILQNELKGSKKSYAQYNYHSLNPNIVASYIIYKIGDDNFNQLLDDVFNKKARIEGDVFFLKNQHAEKGELSFWSQFYATRYDYLRIAKAMLDDWQNDTCVGKYLKTIHDRKIRKGASWEASTNSKSRVGMPKSYAGFFHTGYRGMENRPVMSMDGHGGQTITIDFERGRIVATQAIHDNMKFPAKGSFNWKKIVYERIKYGKPASISTVKVKQPQEPVIDPQQLILNNMVKKEAEEKAKKYWDDHYDVIQGISLGGSADGSTMFSEDFENAGLRDIRVDDRKQQWYIKQDKDGNSIYCNKVTDDWTHFNFGSEHWSDYSISYRMKSLVGKEGKAEMHIRKTDSSDYRVIINTNNFVIEFAQPAYKFYNALASGFVSTKVDGWSELQLIASGHNIKYLVDGKVVANIKDYRIKKGSGFFGASPNSEVCIDDIVVNKI